MLELAGWLCGIRVRHGWLAGSPAFAYTMAGWHASMAGFHELLAWAMLAVLTGWLALHVAWLSTLDPLLACTVMDVSLRVYLFLVHCCTWVGAISCVLVPLLFWAMLLGLCLHYACGGHVTGSWSGGSLWLGLFFGQDC
jgi:hypothetical protein